MDTIIQTTTKRQRERKRNVINFILLIVFRLFILFIYLFIFCHSGDDGDVIHWYGDVINLPIYGGEGK